MNATKVALLLLSLLVVGSTAHRLLEANSQKAEDVSEAAEHQRILSELEEVHQLRERMLQEGEHTTTPCSVLFSMSQGAVDVSQLACLPSKLQCL